MADDRNRALASVPAPGSSHSQAVVAALALLGVVLPLLLVSAGPIVTDDIWFHLAAGRAYASEGPWPARDPLLHTALPTAPVQHEWLFGVGVHEVDRAFGLYGLRVLHLLAVLGLTLGVGALLLRSSPSAVWAAFATAVFLALSWWRLVQLRPDLFSISAALAAYALLFADPARWSWRRSMMFIGLTALWANVHSLFMVGLALGVAVLLGIALEAVLARFCVGEPGRPQPRAPAGRLAAALGLGALAALVNPRGIAQHLTFLHSSSETAVWQVRDEWTHFSPLSWRAGGYAENPVAWALTDALAVAFVATAAAALFRVARERSADRLRDFDAVGFGLGLAAFAAIFVSIRFRWLAFLPLVYLLRAAGRGRWSRGATSGWAVAAATLCLAIALPLRGDMGRWTRMLPRGPGEYLARAHVAGKYHAEGVRFLAESGIEGNLFNHYWMGGFLGYWLAPRLHTFIDGRTEHYAPDVPADAAAISARTGARPGEASHLDVLDRRNVDVFFGVGLVPFGVGPGLGVYTADNLAGDPGWVLVFRAVDQAIYVRTAADNRNLERAARFYRDRGVPFDPENGLEPERVIREAPQFARAWRLLPQDDETLRADALQGPTPARVAAAETLALADSAVGAWSSAIAMAQLALSLEPASRPARRSLVYALLRTGRLQEALDEALALQRLDLRDARSRRIVAIAQRASAGRQDLATMLLSYPLLDDAETAALLAHYRSASLSRSGASGSIDVMP